MSNSWIDRIFGNELTKTEIEISQKQGTFTHSSRLKRSLESDIAEYKNKFKGKNNPYLYQLYRMFNHVNIDLLSLNELMQLGFTSTFITKHDLG